MSNIRENILEASVQVFMRYGVGRTRMGDIAKEAGVVRQTLYSFFKNKDEILCAAIRHYADLSDRDIQNGWQMVEGLEAKLDVFFEKAILSSYQIISASPDARDMIGGYNDAGKAETEKAKAGKISLLARELGPHLEGQAKAHTGAEELAAFIVLAAFGLRDQAQSLSQLEQLLLTLKRSVISQVG